MKIRFPHITLQSAALIILLVLGVDQASKFYIKLNYPLSVYGQAAIVDWGFLNSFLSKTRAWPGGPRSTIFFPF